MIKYDWEDLKLIFNNLGTLCKGSSYLFLIPLFVVLIYGEPATYFYLYVLMAILMRALGNFLTFKSKEKGELRHAIVTISLFWILFCFVASLPFFVIENMSFVDSLFESVSAITTNGLSMVVDQNSLAFSTALWRNFLGWVGGLGFVLLSIFGVFVTYAKFKNLTEAEGHLEKIKSSAKKTAFYFFLIYFGFTIAGILAFRIAGMPLYDSINYAFTTISTTGFDLTNLGLLGYNSLAVLIIALVLTFIGSVSFISHYKVFAKKSILEYFKDKSIYVLLGIGIFSFAFISLKFAKMFDFKIFFDLLSAQYGGLSLYLPKIYTSYPYFVKTFFIFVMFVGGSTASASGGIKIQRLILIFKTVVWQTKSALLPKNAVFQKKLEGEIVTKETTNNLLYYVLLFVLFAILGTFVLMSLGYSGLDSVVEVVSAQSGSGFSVGLATIAMPVLGKIMLIINMLVGRLEFIPIFATLGFLFSIKLRG